MPLEIDDEKFEKVRKESEEQYQTIGKVWCPYLHDKVHFNNEGFEHLLFKSWNRTRRRTEQYIRLRLLPIAANIIRKSHTLQEYDERRMFVRQKINSRWEQRAKMVRYYVFISINSEKNVRLKVIVKEIEGGAKFFYSLYPSWRVASDASGNQRKVFYSGNLEID
jgi:hypothetical protein